LPEWIIETHVHTDHLSGAPYLQNKLGGKIGCLIMFEKHGWDRQKRNFNDVTLWDKAIGGPSHPHADGRVFSKHDQL